MKIENIQQELNYYEFTQNLLSLFKEIKKDKNLPFLFNEAKDESIYNTVVGFYTAKFLIERGTNRKKDEVYEVLQKELDKIKKAEQKLKDKSKQKLESEVQKRLKDYIEGGVKEDGVKIYGNHASITLEDNKKEFKISEFLNSDFCQKNGISGFSTLHSNGKSGMHGFVAEEGRRKIRHYVVTDGSYEMTLNWYMNGEKCTIKINIDEDSIDLIEPNGVTEQLKKQLEANKDVKIGGLFLHQIQFREKGKRQENEVQKNSQSSETFIGSNSQNVSVQAYFGPQSNGRRQSYDSEIGKDFDDKINSQEAEEKRKLRQASREENSGDKVYNLQSSFEENSQNKKTPPPPPPRTSSLKKDVFDEQGKSTSTKSMGQNQDDGQRNEQENLTLKVQQQPKTQWQGKAEDLFQDIKNFKKNNLRNINVDDREASIARDRKNNQSLLEILKDRIPYSPSPDLDIYNNDNQGASDIEWDVSKIREENNQPLSALTINSVSNSGYLSPITDQSRSQIDPEYLNSKLGEEKLNRQRTNEIPKEHGKNSEDHGSETHTVSSKLVEKESRNTQFASPADQAMDELREVLKKTDKGLKEPKQQVTERSVLKNPFPENILQKIKKDKPVYKWLKDKIESKEDNHNLDTMKEKSSQKSGTPKDLFSENILEKIKEDKPIYKWLKDKIEGKENNHNLDVLEKTLSQKSDQGNLIEKRENDDGKPLPPTSTGGNTYVGDTQLQKGSYRSGQKPEEERKFPKTKEALEEWKKKRLNNYRKIDKDIKKVSFDTQGKTQPHHTNYLTPFEELKQRLSQKSYGLKQANPKACYVSSQTRKHLTEAGVLKDSSTDVRRVAERENANTNLTIGKNSELSKLLARDGEQMKIGVIEAEREDTLVEHTNSHDRNRIVLTNRNRKSLWTKYAAKQQAKETKDILR